MKTIYLVSIGEYSDYMIEAVFDELDLAKQYIAGLEDGYYKRQIEEMPLNPFKDDLRNNRIPFLVTMTIEGTVIDVENKGIGFSPKDENNIAFNLTENWMYCHCYANDKKHAIKIANEKRTQYIAMNRWGGVY